MTMVEEIVWFFVWLLLLYLVHYQFKVCIPVTLFVLKFMESLLLLFLLKLFVFFQIHGDGVTLATVTNVTSTFIHAAKTHMAKMDL